jgi:hypothetical protein
MLLCTLSGADPQGLKQEHTCHLECRSVVGFLGGVVITSRPFAHRRVRLTLLLPFYNKLSQLLLWLLAADLAAADAYSLRDAFRDEPAAAALMLEAAVRTAYSKPAATFTAASHTAEAAAGGCAVLLDATLKLCALVVLEDPDDADVRPALLMDLEEADNLSMLAAAQQSLQPAGSGARNVAAVAAAAEAAAKDGAELAQQERLPLLLRVVSLLGSCVKVMARDQQQRRALSWGQVAWRCGRIAELCRELAGYEEALFRQRVESTEEAAEEIVAALDAWCEKEGSSSLSDATMTFVTDMLAQHPYARQLMRKNLGGLHAVLQQCVETPRLPADQASVGAGGGAAGAAARAAAAAAAAVVAAEPAAAREHVLLAALLSGAPSEGCVVDDAATCGEVGAVMGISDQTQAASAAGQACGSSSSSSMVTTLDVKLACMAVAVRAMRLYGTVLAAALSHPCLNVSASAEERSAGAAQLSQQLDRLQAAGELVLLPDVVQ